jgi:predicted ATPase/DNA-binding CsgD family transcriptional regulator/tetratricopeptide (TPR) repeat protein
MSATTTFSRRPSPLPTELTPLLGRTRESDQVRELLDAPANRLVTLTGPGGVGKTRLALHVAATLLDEFAGDVVYVPLASIQDPSLVLPAIAQSFGVFSDVQDAPEDQLSELLHDRRLLLVLDNFEQILGAGPSLASVLARCPGVTALVTSQAPLGISGEQMYPLLPLPVPSSLQTTAEDILRSDAVVLFAQRALSVNPDLTIDDRMAQTIAEICRRLDGLPLAIELAAARTNILSPNALLARLSNRLKVLSGERRGVPDRLRTMRHAIAWSYDLLAPDEQALFRRMSVFVGGISLDAVEAICQPVDDGRQAYDVLSALVDHSLVQSAPLPSGDSRFLMLETLRDYGLEQLEVAGEGDEARLAHAAFFVELSEAAEPHLVGGEQEAWLDRLDLETENLRAAVDWSLTHGHEDIPLRIGGAIWRFCFTRGLASDCRAWLERAFVAGRCEQSPYRAKALIGAGNLFEDHRDLDTAWNYFEQARILAAAIDNPLNESWAMTGLGIVAHDRGVYVEALGYHTQAAALARKAGDQRSIGVALGNMAGAYYYQGNLEDAARCWQEGQVIMATLGDATAEAIAACNLGAVAILHGDAQRAEKHLTRALELQRRMKSSRDLPYTLINLGDVSRILGDYTQSHDCFAEAITLLRAESNAVIEGVALNGVARLALAEGDIPGAASLVLESMRLVEDNYPTCIIDNADLLAEICSMRDIHATAVEFLSAADRNRRELGSDLTPQKVSVLGGIEAAARKALSEQDYADHWQAGSLLDLDALTRRIGIVAREIIGKRQPVILPEQPVEPVVSHNLTSREIEVLRLLAQGNSTREISEALFISPRTAATHITNILGKLDVSSRTAAVAHAMRTGLV